MKAGGAKADQHVAIAHALGAEHLIGFDDAGDCAGDVVFVFTQQSGVFGGFPANECGAGERRGFGDPADDIGDALGNHLAARDVVGHEQWLCPDHDDVVNDHANEVVADRVVHVHGLCDRDLRADPVGGGREVGLAHTREGRGVPQASKAAEAANHLRRVGCADRGAHEFDGEVTGLGVDACGLVGDPLVGGTGLSGHGCFRAPSPPPPMLRDSKPSAGLPKMGAECVVGESVGPGGIG